MVGKMRTYVLAQDFQSRLYEFHICTCIGMIDENRKWLRAHPLTGSVTEVGAHVPNQLLLLISGEYFWSTLHMLYFSDISQVRRNFLKDLCVDS